MIDGHIDATPLGVRSIAWTTGWIPASEREAVIYMTCVCCE
jgi:hypothetical protein